MSLGGIFDIDGLSMQIEEFSSTVVSYEDISTQQKISKLQKVVDSYRSLEMLRDDINTEIELSILEETVELKDNIIKNFTLLQEQYDKLYNSTLFKGKYDGNNALITLHAGAGGTEAQDWCEMLSRVYILWAEKNDCKCNVLAFTEGEVVGFKSITLQIIGNNAYGFLKHEQGVHRLVRVSPYDAASRRHTSFVAIEVIPEIDNTVEVVIKPEELRIDTYRSSGKGGQHVNTTDSAVRITHIPTNTVAACQTERSQLQNKAVAMKMLVSKLTALAEQQHLDSIDKLKGEKSEIAWGNQIRSYVFHPYSMIKDHRSGYEIGNVQKFMAGDINECLFSLINL
jgi:peptide chain release factor 2